MNTDERKGKVLREVLISAFIVGTLDITGAIIHYVLATGKNPLLIFRYIASAVLGADAKTAPDWVLGMGLFLHYCVAMIFTIFFYLVYKGLKLYKISVILLGILYGAFIWLIMNLVVLRLTRLNLPPVSRMDPKNSLIGAGILMLAIGIPLALRARRPESVLNPSSIQTS